MEFIDKILEIVRFLWPFKLVMHWQRAGFYQNGRWVGEVGQGTYFVWWWEHLSIVNMAAGIVSTRKIDLSLEDGTTLSFVASGTRQVVDLYLALNTIDDWKEQSQEVLEVGLADALGSMDKERIVAGSRKRLLTALNKAVAKECAVFGVSMTNIRFGSFLVNAKTIRLVMDAAPPLTRAFDA